MIVIVINILIYLYFSISIKNNTCTEHRHTIVSNIVLPIFKYSFILGREQEHGWLSAALCWRG
jgi:hypothetical protein